MGVLGASESEPLDPADGDHVPHCPGRLCISVFAGNFNWLMCRCASGEAPNVVFAIYSAQQHRERDDVVKLSAALIQELWLLVILGPLCASDMRAQSIPEVFLTDASQDKMASVRADLPSAEFQRHCLARGTWSRLLSPWKTWQRLHDSLLEEEELPDGVPLVSHPLWLLISQELQFRLNHCKTAKSRRHINLLELEAVLELEEKLSKRRGNGRYVCQVTVR